MGRRIRVETEDAVYFVTNRCFHQQFFFRPSPKVNAIIRGVLAWAANRHGVKIYAFVFMSNHFHLLLSAPRLNLGLFMCEFQARLATELNELHGREGFFYQGRYRCEHVLDDEAMIDKLRYTLNNPVKAQLVRHPERWPGVSSWEAHMGDGSFTGRFVLKKELRAMRKATDNPDLTRQQALEHKQYAVELAKLPAFADLDDDAYKAKIEELVGAQAKAIANIVDAHQGSFLGPKAVLAQSWQARPRSPKRSPQPLCHTSCPRNTPPTARGSTRCGTTTKRRLAGSKTAAEGSSRPSPKAPTHPVAADASAHDRPSLTSNADPPTANVSGRRTSVRADLHDVPI